MSSEVLQNKKYRDGQKRKDFFISLFIGIFAFVWIFPILWTVWTSLRPYNDIISYGIFSWPRRLTFDNYLNAVSEMQIGGYLLNSAIVTIPSVILTLFFGSLIYLPIIWLAMIAAKLGSQTIQVKARAGEGSTACSRIWARNC